MSKKIIAVLVLLSVCRPPVSAANMFLAQLAARPGIENASWGVSVKDAATGVSVASLNPGRNLAPASILKVLVTAAAFDRFGSRRRFRTGLYHDGSVAGGELRGNLYLKGAGDPSLGSLLIRNAPSQADVFEAWTQALKDKGIVSVAGAVFADDTAFDSWQPGSWAWEDIGNYYAAAPSALTIGDNLYKIWFKPGAEGAPARFLRAEPDQPDIMFENHMLTGARGSGDNGYVFAFPGSYLAVLRGTVPSGPEEFAIKAALPDPALHAARAFGAYLAAAGIRVSGRPERGAVPAGAALLAETEGAPLADIVRATHKRSFNLYAELLLRQLAFDAGYGGSAADGIKVLKEFLAGAGVKTGELRLVDASGLSRADMVKPEQFTDLLCAVSKKKYFPEYRESLLFPGDPEASGHARNLGKGTWLEQNLRLKSGSISGVRAYTGYLVTRRGSTLAFTSILNNYSAEPAEIDRLHEELLLELAGKY